MSEQLEEAPRPALLRRWLAPAGQLGPDTVALGLGVLGLGVLGLAGFVASLVVDWMQVTITVPRDFQNGLSLDAGDQQATKLALTNVDILGQVYLLGTIGLLGLLGAVLVRPDLALRLRMSAAGVGLGVFGVVFAIALRLPDTQYVTGFYYGPAEMMDELRASARVAYEPGVFSAAGAVLALTVGVWVAARRADRMVAPALTPAPVQPAAVAAPRSWRQDARSGSIAELSVSPSEPVDIQVTPDAWPR